MSMKNFVFWDVTPCGSCKNPLVGGLLQPVNCYIICKENVNSTNVTAAR
jgi:hypothetical protein